MWVKGRAPCGVLGQCPDWVALGAVRPLQGEALAPCKGKAIVELKKTFVVMDVRFPHKDVLLDDYIRQRVIVEFRDKYPL